MKRMMKVERSETSGSECRHSRCEAYGGENRRRRPVKDMPPREKLHLMVNMLDEAYMEEAMHTLGAMVSKSVEDGRQKKKKA